MAHQNSLIRQSSKADGDSANAVARTHTNHGASHPHTADRKGSKFDGGGLCGMNLFGSKDRASDETFNCAVTMARKHKLPLEEVRMRLHEFEGYPLTEEGELTHAEFMEVVRRYCGIESGGDIPPHLMRQFDKADPNACVTFEGFLLWTVVTAWLPERLVSDPEERRLRKIARDNHLCITDVERIKVSFDKFDLDGSGCIEEKEFRNLVLTLMQVKNPADVSGKRLYRYWCEVDTDLSGSINFEEFLQWYCNLF